MNIENGEIRKCVDGGGYEREMQHVATCEDGTMLFLEVGRTGVVGDNADGMRLFEDAGTYIESLPEDDRQEVRELLKGGAR